MNYKSFFFAMLLMLAAHCAMAQRDVYDRYDGRDDIDIVLVRGYRIDSLNKMDVILIRAKDSAGWEWIKEEFNILPLSETNKENLSQGIDVFQTFLANKFDPSQPMDPNIINNCLVKVSFLRKEMGIFYYSTKEQWDILYVNFCKQLKKNNTLK